MGDDGDRVDPWGLGVRLLLEGARSAADVQQRLLGTMKAVTQATPDNDALGAIARYWGEVASSTAVYYRELARAVAGTAGGHDADDSGYPDESPGSERRARIDLRGPVGSAVAATFTVENSDRDPARVSLVQGPCRSGSHEPFAAPATITPPSGTIPGGGSLDVTVQVDLDPELFTPGRTYTVPFRVDGPRTTAVDVTVAVADAPEPDSPPFHVACPTCERAFERTTDNLRLRPHKTPDGHDCPERAGHRVPA